MHQWLYIFSVWVCCYDEAAVWFLHLKEKIGSESRNAVVFCKALPTGTVQSKSAFTLSLVLLTEAACPGLMLLMFLFHFWECSSYWLGQIKYKLEARERLGEIGSKRNWLGNQLWCECVGFLGGWSLEIWANRCYWELHCLPGGKIKYKPIWYLLFMLEAVVLCSQKAQWSDPGIETLLCCLEARVAMSKNE